MNVLSSIFCLLNHQKKRQGVTVKAKTLFTFLLPLLTAALLVCADNQYETSVEITKPVGSADGAANPVSSWLTTPCYHFDFQGVTSGSPGPYVLDLAGTVTPAPPERGYLWALEAAAGTLTNMTTATPTHVEPAAVGEGQLTLEATKDGSGTGIKKQKKLKIYQDHLARDFDNFGVGISCAGAWTFTKFGATITMNGAWNCHGSVSHAFDGSGNGNSTFNVTPPAGWTTVKVDGTDELAYPFSAGVLTAINAMSRGDVVSYNDDTKGAGHSATSTSGSSTWGGNNDMMFPGPIYGESWRWAASTVTRCADNVHANWPKAFAGWNLKFIKIHKRP